MTRVVRSVGRVLLAAIFINSGLDLIQHPEGRTKRAADVLPGMPELPAIGRVHGAAMLGAGATLALGILPSASAAVLAITLIPNTYVGHGFWREEDAAARRGQLVHFLKNTAIFGGLLVVATDTRAGRGA